MSSTAVIDDDSYNASFDSPISDTELFTCIKTIKRRKEPGRDNVQNEHIIHSSQKFQELIVLLFNRIISTEVIPSSWKKKRDHSVLQRYGKPKSDPGSYRPISLIPCLCKLFEKIVTNRIWRFLETNMINFPCLQQQGFQKKLSCITAAFNLQETIFYNIERGSNVYVAFLDIQKAFDTVWHNGLLYKLYKLGIKGKLWQIIKHYYSNLKYCVKVNGVISNEIPVSRSVRQGGVISTFFYLVFIDELLRELESSSFGASICSLDTGNPTLADDISCIATRPHNLQQLLTIVHNYSLKWQFSINASNVHLHS